MDLSVQTNANSCQVACGMMLLKQLMNLNRNGAWMNKNASFLLDILRLVIIKMIHSTKTSSAFNSTCRSWWMFCATNFMSHKAIGTTKYTHHNHANTTQQLPNNLSFLLHSIPWSGIGIPAEYAAVVVAFANVGSQNCEPPPQHTAPVRRWRLWFLSLRWTNHG